MKPVLYLLLSMTILAYTGCAAQTVWTGHPSVQSVVKEDYRITLKAGYSQNGDFFSHFAFTFINQSQERVTIDWRRTRYLHNGIAKGPFIFEGVDRNNVNAPPADVVPSGKRIDKEIWPLSLLAITPYRSRSVPAGKTGFERGVLPAGRNTVDLILIVGNREIRERLDITLREAPAH